MDDLQQQADALRNAVARVNMLAGQLAQEHNAFVEYETVPMAVMGDRHPFTLLQVTIKKEV